MSDNQMAPVWAEVVAVIDGRRYRLGSYRSTWEAEARVMSMIEDGSIEQTDDMYIETIIKSRKYYRQDNETFIINPEGV